MGALTGLLVEAKWRNEETPTLRKYYVRHVCTHTFLSMFIHGRVQGGRGGMSQVLKQGMRRGRFYPGT